MDSWVDGLPPKMVHASCQLLFGRVGRETNQDSASYGFRGKPINYQVTSEIPPLKWIGGSKFWNGGSSEHLESKARISQEFKGFQRVR